MDPFSPDGDGSALELIAPRTAPDHHVAANWRAVELIGELISNEPKLEIHVRSQDCRGHREALVLPREGVPTILKLQFLYFIDPSHGAQAQGPRRQGGG